MATQRDRAPDRLTFDRLVPAGFALMEMVMVVAIIGILSAIMVPSYLAWTQNHRLRAAQDKVFTILRQTQSFAAQQRRPHQASFRAQGDQVTWSIHPIGTPPSVWQVLPYGVQLDAETTLRRSQGLYIAQFNHYGEVNGQLGRVTLSLPENPRLKRCVFISTLLGALRSAQSQPKPQNGKYCY
jgi:prepilin-type N-terminal cleavage/methylation domain-containing protein